jgi:pimeloyl-ACP methyl ester carboxylesterase
MSRRLALPGGEVELDILNEGGAPPTRDRPSALVLLHEGLGSLELWRQFPGALASLTGHKVVVYSRYGYGRSAVLTGPRAVSYMHEEALEVLPDLLHRLGIERPVLVGHSDGASIALIHAGAGLRAVAGVVALAPHVVVEERSLQGIRAARREYLHGDLRVRMAPYHRDPDATFWGWNDVWLSEPFRAWNIEAFLPAIDCPVLLVQCADDRYGTLAQLDRIEHRVAGRVERLVLAEGGHAPHRSHPDRVARRIAGFVHSLQ